MRLIATTILAATIATTASARWNPWGGISKLRARVVNRMSMALADDGSFQDAAKRNGWTLSSCRNTGLTIGLPIITIKGAAVCASVTGGEPYSLAICTTALVTLTGGIITGACIQLCHNGKLKDC
jgi:hypothetical protein